MSRIRTNAAATMLGVSPSTLRSWERRFHYPSPQRSEGGHRQFELAEIEALRQAFAETQNISSAISIAQERGAGLGSCSALRAALESFDHERADRLLEESLAVRSLERTVQTTLLPAVQSLLGEDERQGVSPEYGFAWRYAGGWLAAAQRVAPPASREQGVMIFDVAAGGEIDALYVQALELFLRRAGLRVLTLPVELQAPRLTSAVTALRPDAVVLGGRGGSLDALGRVVYAVRQASGQGSPVEVLDYRGALPDTGAETVLRLGDEPLQATELVRERLTGPGSGSRARAAGSAADPHVDLGELPPAACRLTR